MSFVVDRKSGLLLPFTRCHCGSRRLWRDLNGKLRCWDCIPPQVVIQTIIAEKKAKAAYEQRQVDDFIDEDIDIQEYNYRHHGVRTS